MKSTKNHRVGGWNNTENNKYVTFIKKYRDIIDDPIERKKKKIFNRMSHTIKTRTADQCRGHHLKIKKRYGSID